MVGMPRRVRMVLGVRNVVTSVVGIRVALSGRMNAVVYVWEWVGDGGVVIRDSGVCKSSVQVGTDVKSLTSERGDSSYGRSYILARELR